MTDDPDTTPPDAPPDALGDYARLISGMVHDLRTPLTSIIGAASSLASYADRFDAETRDKLLQSVMDEAEHLDRMLSNLALLARVRGGALRPDRKETRLHDLLLGAAEKMRRSGGSAGLRLARDLPETTLRADPGLLQDALLNLLEVAAKFAPEGAETEMRAHAGDGALAIMWRTPVAPAMQAKADRLLGAFQDGRRGDRVRASDFILLEAAREVVQSHGGRLEIDNNNHENAIDIIVELSTDP